MPEGFVGWLLECSELGIREKPGRNVLLECFQCTLTFLRYITSVVQTAEFLLRTDYSIVRTFSCLGMAHADPRC